jgi:uncharacterized protein (TIGR03437 family)
VPLFFSCVLLALSCLVANAAALVPVPTPPLPSLPDVGLEANKGQAKPGILFLSRGNGDTGSVAVTAQAVLYSPLGATLGLVSSNPNPTVSFSNPLPGLVNSYTGADSHNWITGIPRYSTADLASIYPGINARYTISADGILTLTLMLAAGIDTKPIQFQIPEAASITIGADGSLVALIGSTATMAPRLGYLLPMAFQPSGSGQVTRTASFVVLSPTTFAVAVQGVDPSLPLQISMQVASASTVPSRLAVKTSDAAGNTFFATIVADAAGKDAPFPTIGGDGCGNLFEQPQACSDVAIYKYSAAGVLQFITYLAGETNENAGFVGLSPGGSLVVAGTTDSADFPVTASALQPVYAGPAATQYDFFGSQIGGDFFAVTLDPATGFLQSSTFLGGPNADTMGTAALGSDGSLYFLPAFPPVRSAGMPATSGALQPTCPGDQCLTGYVARLSPGLDRLIYGTYLPGNSQAPAQLYFDGSVYYAGIAGPGFPTTPNAYQPQNTGGSNVIVARLDPTGTHLLFGTYYGGPNSGSTFIVAAIAVAPDGSVWVSLSTGAYDHPHLIHLDSSGSRLLADVPIRGDQMVVDAAANVIALAEGPIIVSKDAILGGSCGGAAYIELTPTGQQLFATYLPVPSGSQISFDGADAQGKPYVSIPPERFQVVESQPTPPSVGCVVDASFTTEQKVSPGAIVTIFGAAMGPSPGVGFQLINGLVPTSLGGTQVLVNGEPAPILYSSYGQLNLIMPYSLAAGSTATLQVISNGTPLNQLSNVIVLAQAVSIFLVDVNASAAALNEDYTVNSPQHPARPGSTVMLFGTGGGQTNPPSVAGEVTPLELRPLLSLPQVYILSSTAIPLNLEYAGAAPTLLSGVTQINVTLPDVIPASYPSGTLHLSVVESGVPYFSRTVTIYVSGN